jgi:hypothetical protein
MAQHSSCSTNTVSEVQRAVIERGAFALKNLATLNFASLVRLVEKIAQEYDKEEWHTKAADLWIDIKVLEALDACQPPVPYPYYFCTPDILTQHPELVMYYRNVAMISQEAMRDLGLNTTAYEAGQTPTPDVATNLACRFNRFISVLVITGGVTPRRHLEMAYINVGADLDELQQTDQGLQPR